MTVQEPTPIRPPKRTTWRDRAWEAVSSCIEPMGTFGPGWEGRWYDPDENEYEGDLLTIAPAYAEVESDDAHNGKLIYNPLSVVDVSDLTRLLGPDCQVWLEQREGEHHREAGRDGVWITAEGRFSRRPLYVEIRCDQPFEDAEPRQHFHPDTAGFSTIDDEDDDGVH